MQNWYASSIRQGMLLRIPPCLRWNRAHTNRSSMSKRISYKEKQVMLNGELRTLPLIREVEIIYSGPRENSPIVIKSSNDAHNVLKTVYDDKRIDYKEFFYVLLLNRANYCIGISKIGMGSGSATVVNIKEIFQLVLKSNANGIILSHNHPSGNTNPSEVDIQLTKKIKDGCELLDINLLDHIIVTSQSYYSFADEGII